jgi:solute carrier family 25 citrate transporter 1
MSAKKSNNPLTAMTAGCIAGAVEASCVWPMEFIKVGMNMLFNLQDVGRLLV